MGAKLQQTCYGSNKGSNLRLLTSQDGKKSLSTDEAVGGIISQFMN